MLTIRASEARPNIFEQLIRHTHDSQAGYNMHYAQRTKATDGDGAS